MGRIEEALRRSKDSSSAVSVADADQNTPFESPWAFGAYDAPTAESIDVFERTSAPGAAPQPEFVRKLEIAPRGDAARPVPLVEKSPSHRFSDHWVEKLVIAPLADSLLIEQFRQLAGSLFRAQNENNTRVVMMTSAEPSEGKSLTTVNLGLTLSGSYRRRVLMIDADLRRPVLHEITRVPGTLGLGNVLKSHSDDKLPVFDLSDTLSVIPAGQADDDPMSALTSPRMEGILEQAKARFDYVLLDAPPIGTLADSSLLASVIDTAVLVVRAGRTSYPSVQKAIEALGRERVFGVVLNGVDVMHAAGYRQYYQSYKPEGGQKG